MVLSALAMLIAALLQFVITAGSTGAFVMRLIVQGDSKQILGGYVNILHESMSSAAIAVKWIPRHHADASLGRSYGLGGVGDGGQPNDVMAQTLCARETAQMIGTRGAGLPEASRFTVNRISNNGAG